MAAVQCPSVIRSIHICPSAPPKGHGVSPGLLRNAGCTSSFRVLSGCRSSGTARPKEIPAWSAKSTIRSETLPTCGSRQVSVRQSRGEEDSRVVAPIRLERFSGAAQSLAENFSKAVATAALVATLYFGAGAPPAAAARRPTGVNKPELLPPVFTRVIDVAGFLSEGQEARLARDLERLEQDTGFKVRLLAQNYPETPGLAVKDFWGVDDATVVFVADPSLSGNILNFNVGSAVDLHVPRSFWSRLAGKYGNQFYWKENGEEVAIENAVLAIDACLREPAGPLACSNIK